MPPTDYLRRTAPTVVVVPLVAAALLAALPPAEKGIYTGPDRPRLWARRYAFCAGVSAIAGLVVMPLDCGILHPELEMALAAVLPLLAGAFIAAVACLGCQILSRLELLRQTTSKAEVLFTICGFGAVITILLPDPQARRAAGAAKELALASALRILSGNVEESVAWTRATA